MERQPTEQSGWSLSRAWLLLLAFDICAVAVVMAQDERPPTQSSSAESSSAEGTMTENRQQRIVQLEGPTDVAADDIRFEAIDVIVDSGSALLAAYQLEVASQTGGVQIVGIEGGEHPAFAEPPFYDPQAIKGNRVILAAFETGNKLPSGRVRVARIHVMLQGPGMKEYRTRLEVSATQDGVEIPATLEILRVQA